MTGDFNYKSDSWEMTGDFNYKSDCWEMTGDFNYKSDSWEMTGDFNYKSADETIDEYKWTMVYKSKRRVMRNLDHSATVTLLKLVTPCRNTTSTITSFLWTEQYDLSFIYFQTTAWNADTY